jgi:hypothetical protein
LSVLGFVSLSGNFAFEKTGTGADTKLLVGATDVDAFLGTDDQSMGIQIENADLGMVMYANSTYALTASATAALVGFDGVLSISGNIAVKVNTTGAAVTESIDVDGTPVAINFTAEQGNYQAFAGSVTLSVLGFVSLSGNFAFEKTGTGADTRLLVGATDVDAFLGTDDQTMGIQIENADLGMVMYANSTYALTASATAALVGFDGF